MRAARAIVALFVLLSIVLGTTGMVSMRADSQLTACDDSADPPACTEAPQAIVLRIIHVWSVFEHAPYNEPSDVRRVAILTSAPKTSPPAV